MEREPDRFEESLKAWASKAPKISAEEAAGQVLRRLAARERPAPRPFWIWANAAATLLLAVVLTARFSPSLDPVRDFGSPPEIASPIVTPAIPEGVVVMWLDPETPLYMTMDNPAGDSSP